MRILLFPWKLFPDFLSTFTVNNIIYYSHGHLSQLRSAHIVFYLFFSRCWLLLLPRWSKSSVKQEQTMNKIRSEGSWTLAERRVLVHCLHSGGDGGDDSSGSFSCPLLLSAIYILGMWCVWVHLMWMFSVLFFHCAFNSISSSWEYFSPLILFRLLSAFILTYFSLDMVVYICGIDL